MNNWSNWVDIACVKSNKVPFNDFGIYEIRVVDPNGQPIPISRLVGGDHSGLIYIGRSGFRTQKTKRTITKRIQEFLRKKNHSGGITYAKASSILNLEQKFLGHNLQVRAMFLSDQDIKIEEAKALDDYFLLHAELPPCNSEFAY